MADAPFDQARAHKWFGIEFNNQAWALWEKPSRTEDETERMVQMAYASCLHWSYVGGPENRQRGLVLLTCTLTAAGLTESAADAARKCVAAIEAHQALLTDFDLATGFGSAVVALRRAGEDAETYAIRAREAAVKLSHPGDVKVAAQIMAGDPAVTDL